ncbi:hypothetical protein BT96DRAFT_990506 [Gymnopus androsaceus JB14]|uniref:Uncharacterized protein n=1 Tax=Gymnopus androsaceus JB14 TaxID=1447944 RepID=A0A6A4I3A5_9AGAR|nr:hypothetical protein BT96DRAFT_990506 [Gymnopus androsaceus JB14]
MSFVSSHAGSVIYPESSSGSNIIYAAPSSSYGHPHHQAHYASAPGSYYGHYHAAPMQHNFYGAPPSMMMPGHGGYMAPAPAYHRSSYSAPYGYGSPYPAYGAAQPTVIEQQPIAQEILLLKD